MKIEIGDGSGEIRDDREDPVIAKVSHLRCLGPD